MFFLVLAGLVGAASANLAAAIPTTVAIDGTISNGAALEHFWSKGVRRGLTSSLIHRVPVTLTIVIPASRPVGAVPPMDFTGWQRSRSPHHQGRLGRRNIERC